jgi:hypothetical protein
VHGKDSQGNWGQPQSVVVQVTGAEVPDFAIAADPSSHMINPSDSTLYNLTVAPVAGFNSPVTLSVTGLPSGSTATFNPNPATFGITFGSSSTPSALVQPTLVTSPGSYTVTLSSGEYEITDAGEYSAITMDGFGYLLTPGEPKLSSKIFLVAIPPNAEITSVELVGESHKAIPGNYRIMPAPPHVVFGTGSDSASSWGVTENASIYASNAPYPTSV